MANVLVNASGLKSRPSCPSSVKTGMNETVMIKSEKKSAGPTSFDDSTTTRQRSVTDNDAVLKERDSRAPGVTPTFATIARSRCLCMFSIITIAASIMAPMAMAMPPNDMMSAPTPTHRMATKASRIPIGSVMIATSAEVAWRRKRMQTAATMTLSSISLPRRFSMDRSIRSLRS